MVSNGNDVMPRQPTAIFIAHAHLLARAVARNDGYPYTAVSFDSFSGVWEAKGVVRGYTQDVAT